MVDRLVWALITSDYQKLRALSVPAVGRKADNSQDTMVG